MTADVCPLWVAYAIDSPTRWPVCLKSYLLVIAQVVAERDEAGFELLWLEPVVVRLVEVDKRLAEVLHLLVWDAHRVARQNLRRQKERFHVSRHTPSSYRPELLENTKWNRHHWHFTWSTGPGHMVLELTWFSSSLMFLAIEVRSCSQPTRRVCFKKNIYLNHLINNFEQIILQKTGAEILQIIFIGSHNGNRVWA